MHLESNRKHQVIKFLDIVGHPVMMQEDEEKTQKDLKHERKNRQE